MYYYIDRSRINIWEPQLLTLPPVLCCQSSGPVGSPQPDSIALHTNFSWHAWSGCGPSTLDKATVQGPAVAGPSLQAQIQCTPLNLTCLIAPAYGARPRPNPAHGPRSGMASVLPCQADKQGQAMAGCSVWIWRGVGPGVQPQTQCAGLVTYLSWKLRIFFSSSCK